MHAEAPAGQDARSRKDSRPHICFVAPKAFPLLAADDTIQVIGGAELQQVIVARGLVQRGYTVTMICLDYGQEDSVYIDGVRVLRAHSPGQGLPGIGFLWPRLTTLWTCLDRAGADIYYQRSASMLTGVVAHYCRIRGKKSVFAASGNPNLERNTSRIQYGRDRWIYEYGLKHADRILVQNAEQLRLCRENFERDATLVPNCYSISSQWHVGSTEQILWVSRIRAIKRPRLFLDLAAALPQHRFTMIGGPGGKNKQLFETVRAQANELQNVTFTGFVPYSEIDKYFDQAALLINTSESEGFPNTFLQAWARGIPSISFIDSGARMEGRKVGVQVDTFNEMYEVVSQLMCDGATRSKIGQESRKYMEAVHSTDRVLDLYEQLFTDLNET
jgi:glycosyltransferase involved in cell wall biosynthesis